MFLIHPRNSSLHTLNSMKQLSISLLVGLDVEVVDLAVGGLGDEDVSVDQVAGNIGHRTLQHKRSA